MRARTKTIAFALAIPLAASCSFLKPRADAAQYFVLTSEEPSAAATPTKVVLGVDRISLPEYLMRPEMATRSDSNQLKFAENDQWGEPLKDGFSGTLRRDLEHQLGAGQVIAAPFEPTHRPTLVLDVEVRRFERVLVDGAVLEAKWILRDNTSGAVLVTKEVRVRQPVAANDARASVAALSKALAVLAGEIADAVRRGGR